MLTDLWQKHVFYSSSKRSIIKSCIRDKLDLLACAVRINNTIFYKEKKIKREEKNLSCKRKCKSNWVLLLKHFTLFERARTRKRCSKAKRIQAALVRVLWICLLRHLSDYFDSSWGNVRRYHKIIVGENVPSSVQVYLTEE